MNIKLYIINLLGTGSSTGVTLFVFNLLNIHILRPADMTRVSPEWRKSTMKRIKTTINLHEITLFGWFDCSHHAILHESVGECLMHPF